MTWLSLVLLTGASQFIRCLENLRSLDPGFQTQNVLPFELNLELTGYDLNHARIFFRTLEERLKRLPSIESTGTADMPALSGSLSLDHASLRPTEDGFCLPPGLGRPLPAQSLAVPPGQPTRDLGR